MRSYIDAVTTDTLSNTWQPATSSGSYSRAHAQARLVTEVATAFGEQEAEDPAAGKELDVHAPVKPPPPPDNELPPIHCENHSAQDYLDVVREHAKGEREMGRGQNSEDEGPATATLLEMLQPKGRAKRMAALKEKHKSAAKYYEEVIKQTPWKVEKLRRKLPTKRKPKPKPNLGLDQKGKAIGELCSRTELVEQGPYPLEKRLGELAAHAYYLWGDAKYLAYRAEGSTAETTAQTIERFAKMAEGSARRAAKNANLPMSNVPPYLPQAVSYMPISVTIAALGMHRERRERQKQLFL